MIPFFENAVPHADPRPVIGITMGDPLGIGPEILVKALQHPDLHDMCKPLVIGDHHIMARAISQFAASMGLHQVAAPKTGRYEPGCLNLLAASALSPDMAAQGSMTPDMGRAMADYITTGVDLALNQEIAALVTCPITKTGLKLAGSPFHGHTELIASRTNTQKFAMMLAGERLKVVLVTIHIPLAQVCTSLTRDKIVDTILLTADALQTRFDILHPRLAVAGLNPHAGEDGLFGMEEKEIIVPAVSAAQKSQVDVVGPLPPDTVFCHAMDNKYDAVVCMYHDQGLIPFKLIHFADGVNITLGLPIIRTSVDHGTAYDIAWQGKADPSSLVQAIKTAVFQAQNRTDHGR
ncbi:MAG: 4-hydroxythreonine-4-phosphate dehydrogenase PdxA [Desulfotignum sp.]|jgi:4-hydroxythreonine-4-phosphate dehydrogenase|nr:4-hydroxythreonine-4-phosphate dehydrogenase PdxA [Desulfotignum sp.]